MQIFSTFEHTSFLEMAISLLEQSGIDPNNIFAVPLDNRKEDRRLFDTLHKADGVSLIDIAMALATAFSVIGASIGFILAWGPIYWGLIGAFVGFVVGFAIKYVYLKITFKNNQPHRKKNAEVILIVECEDTQAELVEKILWEHFALGVAKIK